MPGAIGIGSVAPVKFSAQVLAPADLVQRFF